MIIFALFAAIALAMWIKFSRSTPEPVYRGKTFSDWFQVAQTRQIQGGPPFGFDPEVDYLFAMQGMGTAAIPRLLEQIRIDDSWLFNFYYRHNQSFPSSLRRVLPNPRHPGDRQLLAVNLLGSIGPPVREYTPQLIAIYNHNYIREHHLPPGTKIIWAKELAHPLPAVGYSELRQNLLRIIIQFGGDDPEVVPLILSSFAQNVPVWLPDDYAAMLTSIKSSEPLLLTNVSNPDPNVRMIAIKMLGILGSEQPQLSPLFLKATSDPNLSVQRAGLLALEKTQPPFELMLPILDRLRSETNDFIRLPAQQTLLGIGGGMKMFGRLSDALENTNAAVRIAAARILRDYPARARIAETRLISLTNSMLETNESVRREAVATLETIQCFKEKKD